jgi:hypothetical protein
MGVLMLNCPVKGREFSTGINIDDGSFRKLPDTIGQAHCPHCGLMHIWWTREARWVERIPPSQWVETLDQTS